MQKPKIHVILSSIRDGRAGENVSKWLMKELEKNQDADFELVDLKDYSLPLFNFGGFPSMVKDGDYGNSVVNKWAQKISQADGYIVISPEYNHGYSSALKNAIDWIYQEWNNKAIGFVSYGSIAGGSRAVEQLRQIAAELQMADVRTAIHIPNVWSAFNEDGSLKDTAVGAPIDMLTSQLIHWAAALRHTRVKVEVTA